MSRRIFLKSLLGTVAAVPLVRVSKAAAPSTVLIQESPLAGFQYHAGESVWGALREGDALSLVREPQNPYDPRAVRVDWRGRKLGYVPRMENTAISQMLDRGERLTARILQLRESHDPWERVRLTISIDG